MNIVLVGVGGSGISSLAYIFRQLGYTNIIGIDKYESQITENLKKEGFEVIIGHGIYQVTEEDFVIYSDAAVNSPEVQTSMQLGDKNLKKYHCPFSYHEFLGEISKYFKTISIAGTHGKSTTTSMTIYTLSKLTNNLALGVVGALVPQLDNKNYYINNSLITDTKSIFDHILTGKYKLFEHKNIKKYFFVVEADEFNKHFLHYDSDYTVILNMELDHSDVYPTYKEYLEVFQELYLKTRFAVFGLNKVKEIEYLNDYNNKLNIVHYKKFDFKYIFGDHNNGNGSLVYALIKKILPKVKSGEIVNVLTNFKGIRRRMEYLGKNDNGALIYTDYGHHPSELNSVFNAFKGQFPEKKLIAVFQPHQARRVLEFWDNFINVIAKFDKSWIYDIYTARENLEDLKKQFHNKEYNDVSSVKQLGDLIASKSKSTYTESFDDVVKIINESTDKDIVICFSAGDLDYKLRSLNIMSQ